MSENNVALMSKCMSVLCEQVGIVDAERFLFFVRSEAFDYTKWQRDYFDKMSPKEINASLEKYSAEHEFKGSKAKII